VNLYKDLKERAFRCNLEIPKHGLAIYTFGNVSVFDPHRAVFAIKPSGVPYENLKADDMVVVDLDYRVVEGKLRPSSDTKTHAVLYRNFHDIGGIAHTHSTYAVAWAQANKSIPIFGTTHADHLQSDIPCTEQMNDEMIRGDYEEETGNQIIKTFKNLSYKEIEMVLVASHGPFTWGTTAEKAVYNSAVLEEIAKMAYLTLQINSEAPQLKSALIEKHYRRKHGSEAYYGQNNSE
jgi:L-ribulose-5-phosphate 4-epimerase